MNYRRCGHSGLLLPALSLGLWHNFGDQQNESLMKDIVVGAFDAGITHFDLANNYGPPPGAAEINFGDILKKELSSHRDEMVISTKAGFKMWDGPYGEWGSRKHMLSSLDQSLQRLGLEYVDIFYSHRPDPKSPIEETMSALESAVKQGKALYAGISNYKANMTHQAKVILEKRGTPLLVHQTKYSMLYREPENELFTTLQKDRIGCTAFCPLAQGLLSDKYLKDIPEHSRAKGPSQFLNSDQITPELLKIIGQLNELAKSRSQTLAQMALAWALHHPAVTSVLIGASRLEQIHENVQALNHPDFSDDEIKRIEDILANA